MIKRITASALLCALALPLAAAELKDFPSGTKWVLNLDVKAAQGSPILSYLAEKAAPAKRLEVQNKLAAIKAMFGVDLLKDIDQLIIAGNGNAEKGGVAYVYGTFDTQRLTTILAGSEKFAALEHSGFKMLTWNDGKPKCLSFARPGLAMLSSSQSALADALDVLAGKKAGLSPDSPLKPSITGRGQNLLSLQATDVPSIVGEQPKAQAIRQAQSLRLQVNAAQPESLSAQLTVGATTEETAVQIRQALLGIQALALLRSAEEPEQASLAALAKITGEGKTVGVTMDLPKSAIETAMRQREARQAAKEAQRAAAPQDAAAHAAAAP
jgi:hypothetical protein